MAAQRAVLYDYFKQSADIIRSEYLRTGKQRATANLGRNREIIKERFLRAVLPGRLRIGTGEVWDAEGNKSGQVDMVIYRDDTPVVSFGGADSFLVEGVLAVIEVKSNLTVEKLREALGVLAQVAAPKVPVSGGLTYGEALDRPLRCIWAYEGASLDRLAQELVLPSHSEVADLVCVLNRGAIIREGLLLEWPGGAPFATSRGSAAALGWLQYHLATYSAMMIARPPVLNRYFMPINGWGEDVR